MRALSLCLLLIALSCAAIANERKPFGAKPVILKPLQGVHRILFLGDSITYAGGYVEAIDAWLFAHCPEQRYELLNIGLPSETVSGLTEPNHAGGAFPRPDLHERLARALAKTKPDLVVACYGMNDGIYYPFDPQRFAKYQEGLRWTRDAVRKAGAKFWVLTPPPFDPQPILKSTLPAGKTEYPSGQPFIDYDTVLARYSAWIMEGRQGEWNAIDIHTPLNSYLTEQRKQNPAFAMSGDGVHINAIGHLLIARELLRGWGAPEGTLPPLMQVSGDAKRDHLNALIHDRQRLLTDAWLTDVGHKRPGMQTGVPVEVATQKAAEQEKEIRTLLSTSSSPFPGLPSDYHGFARYDFTVDGVPATVVAPERAMPGKPWIWRAEFFDHRPELDLALLKRGFHLVYIEVGNTFGAPSAMKRWDAFYGALTHTYGLSSKPVLEGLSRGGLYIYNWAAANPTKVAVLYGDNPVCDFKSWPGGKGVGPGSPPDWQKLIHDYGFASEAEAMAYTKNPIDNLAPLARAHVPIIHLAADADEAVPYAENTVLLKERYEKLGGTIVVMVKHGFKHHPHGLDDPTPLIDFIAKYVKFSPN
jgi:lysophospholipase L1-like esterase